MPYDIMNDIKKVREYYEQDPLQQRYSALITGESGSGKTYIARTCRMPVHVDSFDPGGTKSIRSLIASGQIIADTRWEKEDPFNPTAYEAWKKETDYRFEVGYFDKFGTYMLDSASTFADAVMNAQMGDRAGEVPRMRKDYNPQKVSIINRIKKFMTLECDFILTGHLDTVKDIIGRDKYDDPIYDIKYRFMTTGKAVVTIPMQFDELYIVRSKETSSGVVGELTTFAQGKYLARSRLREDGLLDTIEPADIKHILKKIGLDWQDKPPLVY